MVKIINILNILISLSLSVNSIPIPEVVNPENSLTITINSQKKIQITFQKDDMTGGMQGEMNGGIQNGVLRGMNGVCQVNIPSSKSGGMSREMNSSMQSGMPNEKQQGHGIKEEY
ncbi:hypothetical protein PIROE2DRAFT_18794 [Piromyces sp. E2]|nr:hypothetical protein PIROE2DRAFT_18794 [Piromyces sp. E2]|eukprot:OUM56552.1 hypothetical protein PIROE2DRAFT_18794 [Piromyces sp. E2]